MCKYLLCVWPPFLLNVYLMHFPQNSMQFHAVTNNSPFCFIFIVQFCLVVVFAPSACVLFKQSFFCISICHFFSLRGSSFCTLYWWMNVLLQKKKLYCLEFLLEWRITWQNILIFEPIQLRQYISMKSWIRVKRVFDAEAS